MRAVSLKHGGWSQRAIADALGVSEPAVSQWLTAARRGGPNALRSHPTPGRDCRLTMQQQWLIPEFLWHGPEAYGFRGQVWTCAGIARVLQEETPEGKVYTLVRQDSLNGLLVIEFLMHLLDVAGQRLLMIWDGSPIHRRTEVGDFVAGTRGKIRLEALPGYAPDLNPWDEGGWNHLKHVQLRNVVCRDLEELHEQFHLAVGRLRQKPQLVKSFFAQAGLILEES